MKFRHESTYHAPIDEVFTMLGDPDFRARVCDYQGDLRYDVAIEGTDATMSVDVDRVQSAQGLPPVASKFVGDEIEIEVREEWSSPAAATMEVTIPGKPGQVRGTIAMRENAGVTIQNFAAEIKVSLPFIGGKLEEMIGALLTAALRAENKVGAAWLAGE